MIEPSDMNDKEILDATQREGAANGSFRLKYKMPNGQDVTSEWVSQENAKPALRAWPDAVRAQVVSVAQGMAREKGRAKREAEARVRSGLDDDISQRINADLLAKAMDLPGVDASSDPCEHAKNQVTLLEAEERHWLAESERATKHLATARDKLRKWKLIKASFDAGETNG